MSELPADIAKLSYEQARTELVAVVQQLEATDVTLEDALALWERGEALAAHCETWLAGARKKLAAARAKREEKESAQDDA